MTPAQAREHLRGVSTDDDTYLTGLIAAITAEAEAFTQRGFITQTWKHYQDFFYEPIIEIPIGPIQSITSVKYYDENGTLQTLSGSLYQADLASEPSRILLAPGVSTWPSTQADRVNSVEIEFVVGYGSAATDVPAGIIQACKLAIGTLFNQREDIAVGAISSKLDRSFEMMLYPYRLFRFP